MTWQPGAMPSCAPRLVHRPPGAVGTFGPEATELAAEAGLELDDWQAWYMDGALAYDHRGRWVGFENGLLVPRQNGKGGIIEARMLAGLFLLDERLLTYTAHEFKTAQEHFARIEQLVDSLPPRYKSRVKRVRRASGAEAVELKGGARLRFLARSAGSGRGFSGDVIFFDEAMILWAAAIGALLPTLSARTHVTVGGPQLWYLGSGSLGEPSAVFDAVRARAIAGDDAALFFAEWSASQGDDWNGEKINLDDRAAWWRANPALHGTGRITEEFITKERAAMPEEEFARERLGLGTGAGLGSPIDPDVWRGLGVAGLKLGTRALAVDVPPEGKRATIARADTDRDGRAVVEVDTRPGTQWAVDRLADLSKRRNAPVVLDGATRAASLIPGLVKQGVTPIVYSTRQVVRACSGFMDKVDEDGLRHAGQPELNLAVDGARRRKVGDAWAWHRRDASIDIGPLVAATLAVEGLNEEPPRRKTGRAMAV